MNQATEQTMASPITRENASWIFANGRYILNDGFGGELAVIDNQLGGKSFEWSVLGGRLGGHSRGFETNMMLAQYRVFAALGI